jgi:hypothetical protein
MSASTATITIVQTTVTTSAAVRLSVTAIALPGHDVHCETGSSSISATMRLPPTEAIPPTRRSHPPRRSRRPSG